MFKILSKINKLENLIHNQSKNTSIETKKRHTDGMSREGFLKQLLKNSPYTQKYREKEKWKL